MQSGKGVPSRAALDSDSWRGARKCAPTHPMHKKCAAQRRERNSRVSRDTHARIRCTKSAPRRRESAALTQRTRAEARIRGGAPMARRTRFWRVRSPSARSQHARNDFKVASKNSPRRSESAIFAPTCIAKMRPAARRAALESGGCRTARRGRELHRAEAAATFAAKPSTTPQRHERTKFALRRVVGGSSRYYS